VSGLEIAICDLKRPRCCAARVANRVPRVITFSSKVGVNAV
jgi:hypothetical protein